MTKRGTTLLSWFGLGALLMIAVSSAVGSLLNGVETTVGYRAATSMLSLSFAAIAGIGAVVVVREVAPRIGWLLTLVGTLGSFFVFAERLGLRLFDDGELEAAEVVVTAGGTAFALFLPVLAVLFFLFPTGKLPSRSWLPVFWVAIAVNVVMLVVSLWALQYVDDLGSYLRSNWNLRQGGSAVPEGAIVASDLVTVSSGLSVLVAATSLILRLRTSSGAERQQVKWVVYTGAIAGVGWTLALSTALPSSIAVIPAGVGTFALTAGFAMSLFRYRLYDIDRILSRTISYAVVVGLLALAYAGGVTAISTFLPTQNALAVAASTLAVAALFNPLRKRIQHLVDKRFNRPAYEAEQISEQFASRLQSQLSIDELAMVWADTVDEVLEPDYSGVWIRETENPPS